MLDGLAIFSSIRDRSGRITDFRYEYANETLCERVGVSAQQLIGNRLLKLFPANIESGLFADFREVVETGESLAREALSVARRPRPKVSTAELDERIEQATVDCYNDSEHVTGLFTMIEEHLALPFQTTVLGTTITVARVDVTTSDQIIAICKHDGHRQAIPILDLPLPSPFGVGVQRRCSFSW